MSVATSATLTAALQTVNCQETSSPPGVICIIDALSPSDQLNLQAIATTGRPGSYYNFLVTYGEIADVCAGGDDEGEICEDDGDCTGGTCEPCDDGAPGFCSAGPNVLQPCESNDDCPEGSCISVGTNLALGLACTSSQVVPAATAPAASPWALALGVLLLLALGGLGLRRHARSR